MRIYFDPDEYETVTEYRPCSTCKGDSRKCNGACNGMSSYGLRRRPFMEVQKIKAEKRRKEEDEILAKAEAIRAARGGL